MANALDRLRTKLQRHGAVAFAHQVGMKALNRALLFKILRGVTIDRPAADFLEYPKRYTAGILSEAQLRSLARHEENEMSQAFLDQRSRAATSATRSSTASGSRRTAGIRRC